MCCRAVAVADTDSHSPSFSRCSGAPPDLEYAFLLSRDADAAKKEVDAIQGGYMKRNLYLQGEVVKESICLDGDYTPDQLRAIALCMETGKL